MSRTDIFQPIPVEPVPKIAMSIIVTKKLRLSDGAAGYVQMFIIYA